MKSNSTGKPVDFYKVGKEMFDRIKPLTPNKPAIEKREWVGLTDDEVYKIAFALEGENWRKIADAIETKLKEKNT